MKLRLTILLMLLALGAGCTVLPPEPPRATTTAPESSQLPREALNPDVRQETIQQTICVAGYAASVRPSTSFTNGVKAKLLREQQQPASSAADCELDHRVPLALGGHPRNLTNLALQMWQGSDGSISKDRLERRLHRLVCADKVLLREAQHAMYFDWKSAEAWSAGRK